MRDFLGKSFPEQGKSMRRVRSFVLREGRMTSAQHRALEHLWPKTGLSARDGVLDVRRVFGSDMPLVLEIGYGTGSSLVTMAKNTPDTAFVGIEVHRPGVGALLQMAQEAGLSNLRTYCDDAVDVLTHCIGSESVDRIQIYFPDPWPKKKHHKRRLVQPEFIKLLRTRLRAGGILHMATDWEDYADHMMAVMTEASGWENCAGPQCFSERPDWRPVTRFEQRGTSLGHAVRDLVFRKTILESDISAG